MSSPSLFQCSVCASTDNHTEHFFRDNMFGGSARYRYHECAACGVIAQQDIPADLSPYYPPEYYSYNPPPISSLKRFLKQERMRYALTGRGVVGRVAVQRWGTPPLVDWVKVTGVTPSSRILDVGCGSGAILKEFEIAGFNNLYGIDPFVPHDVTEGRIEIHKRDINEEDRTFDLVMFHHSFEHVRDPLSTLTAARQCLSPQGWLLIRTPVAQTYAWRTFRDNWFQLEAPRHLYIHSVTSLRVLAERADLELVKVEFDSSAFMFWSSIQAQKGIPLRSANSYDVDRSRSIFSSEEISSFGAQAAKLNSLGDADAAAFYFRKKDLSGS